MFKKLTVVSYFSENVEKVLQIDEECKLVFTPCGELYPSSSGFVKIGEDDEYFLRYDHFYLMKFQFEDKIIPTHVINEELKKRIEEFTQKTGEKPKKYEKISLKEEVYFELVKTAFTKTTQMYIIVDTKNKRILFESVSDKKIEDILSKLRKEFGVLNIKTLTCEKNVNEILTSFINQSMPHFDIGEKAVLIDPFDSKTKVTVNGVDLRDKHGTALFVDNGFMIKSITLVTTNMADQMVFTLDDSLKITGIKLSEETIGKMYEQSNDYALSFEGDFIIVSAVLTELIDNLIVEFNLDTKLTQEELRELEQ